MFFPNIKRKYNIRGRNKNKTYLLTHFKLIFALSCSMSYGFETYDVLLIYKIWGTPRENLFNVFKINHSRDLLILTTRHGWDWHSYVYLNAVFLEQLSPEAIQINWILGRKAIPFLWSTVIEGPLNWQSRCQIKHNLFVGKFFLIPKCQCKLKSSNKATIIKLNMRMCPPNTF